MPRVKEVFNELSKRLGAPGSKRFAKILAAMMSAEEAEILLQVPVPLSLKEIAAKLKTDEKNLKTKLDDMEKRQVIRKFKDNYVSPNNIVAFHHGAIGWIHEELKAKVYPLWDDFFFAEWRDIIVDEFISRKKRGTPGAHRVVPAHKALLVSPNIKQGQILWYEDMEQILKRSQRTFFMMCGCRGLWRKCENPIDVCLQVQFPTAGKQPNRLETDFIKPPREVKYEEALKIVDDCEDRGLVHIPLNTSHGDLFCNCCEDCCMVINPMLHRGGNTVWEILSPSRYRAVVDEESCSGCQTCIKRCKFSAIEMKLVPGSKKQKSSIIKEHCMGCGVCVLTCQKNALTLELVRPPEHIPTVTVPELFSWGMKT